MSRSALLLAMALLLAACGQTAPRLALPDERAFPPGFVPPVSFETGRPVHGWGGGDGRQPPSHTPVIFVHGNTVDAGYWHEARAAFLAAGWNDGELWAPGYGHHSTWRFDSNDLSAATLDAFVDAVQRWYQTRFGRRVERFDIVAHSLGVTVVRQWMTQGNRWHRVRNFVAIAGANHGTWTAYPDASGPSRVSSFELAPGSAWLAQLNRDGETAGDVRTLALYDGTGRYDVFYPPPLADSPALAGATNLAINREQGGGHDHLELGQSDATLAAVTAFLRAAPEPLPQATPPVLVRDGDQVRAEPASAELRCVAGGRYPTRADPPANPAALAEGLNTCFARDPASELASTMARYVRAPAATQPWTLRAQREATSAERPTLLHLQASDPDVLVVYSLIGTVPDSGAARAAGPVTLAGPLRATAIAIGADGRASEPLVIDHALDANYRAALEARRR